MPKVGTLVRVLYPEYAAGMRGSIEAREEGSGRWIVRLERNLIEGNNEPLLLSLKESEFVVIQS
jgi:hypothetical protein